MKMSFNSVRNVFLIFVSLMTVSFCYAQVGVKYTNQETTDYTASMKSENFTYLVWDRNDEGDGNFTSETRPMFFYWDNDNNVLGYLIDTRNMHYLNAKFQSADLTGNLDVGGDILTDKLSFSTTAGLDIDLGSAGGDLSIYDAGGTKHILGDQDGGDPSGIVLRTTVNPSPGNPLFVVESSGNSQRLRVEHDGALSTSNYLEVHGTGPSFIKGTLAVSGSSVASGYQFSVDGKAIVEEINVEMSGNWPDYVFSEDYDLMTLEELENYINKNRKLPGVLSAEEVKKDGVALGETSRVLLEKIEELTLYSIKQNEEINELKEENEKRKKNLELIRSLEERVTALEDGRQ